MKRNDDEAKKEPLLKILYPSWIVFKSRIMDEDQEKYNAESASRETYNLI